MIKIYIALFIISIMGAVGYGAFYYYKDTQSRIATLTGNSAKLEVAAKMQEETINTMIEDRMKFEQLNKDLNIKLVNANKYKLNLLSKLRKINLKKLSAEEPAIWEKKINNASKRLLESFESITTVPAVK
jgi:hypothetical protein